MKSVTGLPDKAGMARDAAILAAVDIGQMRPVWVPVTSEANGHAATFYVLADALKINGIRISTSATVLQQIADKLGASLMTPRLLDLAFQQAQVQIPPCPLWPNDDSTSSMDAESAKMDQYARGALRIAPIGKNWVLSNVLVNAKKDHAALYGWPIAPQFAHMFQGAGLKTFPGTLPGIANIQPLATVHDRFYTDYAMLTSLVKRACIVDGQPADFHDVLTNPTLAPLASHEGPLRILRQPGAPEAPEAGPVDSISGIKPSSDEQHPGTKILVRVRHKSIDGVTGMSGEQKDWFDTFANLLLIPVIWGTYLLVRSFGHHAAHPWSREGSGP
jgi:hypothetical protein